MGGLFAPKTQPAPVPKDPAPMPDANAIGVIDAKRRAQQDVMRRAGRTSTILTAPSQRGGDYTSRTLGAA